MEIDEAPGHSILQTLWVQDDEARTCRDCKDAFTILNRRHHCRRCMEIFCAKCSGNVSRLKLHGYPNEEVRVCNKCLYEAGKENEYADKFLGLVRKGLSAQLHPVRREGTKEAVVFRLDNAFPQFIIERADAVPDESGDPKPTRGLAIIDMAVIRPLADSTLTMEITTRSDTLRFDCASEAERDLWVEALKETKVMYMRERPFEKRAKQVGRIVQAKDFWDWVEQSSERRNKRDPIMGTFRTKYGAAPLPEPKPPRELQDGEIP